jgi:hypothetical protein
MRSLRSIAALAALLAAAACDSPTDSTPSESEVTFAYRLGSSNSWISYEQSGNQPAGVDLTTRGEWVYAITDGPGNYSFVVAQQRITADAWVDFWVLIPLTERGDVIHLQPTDAGPCPEGQRCTYMQVILNPTATGGQPAELCEITNGEMELRRVSVEVVSATFSGTGTCTGGAAPRAFEIRNGELDAVLPQAQAIS